MGMAEADWQRNVADRRWCGCIEQLPGTCDIGLAARAGEEAVVTDAVKALRKNVEQEAADEFVRAQCHGTLAIGAVAAIILVAERDARSSSVISRRFEMATRWVYRDK